jgi:hypothetical protein
MQSLLLPVVTLSVPESGKVQVELFNQLGQRVSILFSDRLARGEHRISLAGKVEGLPAGSYLINVQTNGKTIPVKMIIQ